MQSIPSEGSRTLLLIPHSRLQRHPGSDAERSVTVLVVASPLSGWSVATRQTEGRVVRSPARHPSTARSLCSRIPARRQALSRRVHGAHRPSRGLPRCPGIELLESYRARCDGSSVAPNRRVPFDEAAEHVCFRWEQPRSACSRIGSTILQSGPPRLPLEVRRVCNCPAKAG